MHNTHTSSTTPPPAASEPGGPIAWMVNNHVAANLLMVLVLLGGIFGMFRVKQEIFPEFDLDMVVVSVPYPGASPAEVEQGIVLAVEEAVRGLDGVKRVTSSANDGAAMVRIELLLGANADKALADVKSAIDRITTFPKDAEKPTVAVATRRREVVSLIIAGDQSPATLHALAEKARAGLLDDPHITQAEITGVRPLEVSVDIPQDTLMALGVSLDDVARQIAAASVEMPGGSLTTEGGQILLRVADRRHAGQDISDIILRGTHQGYSVRLGDVATVNDGYASTDQESFYNGQPAVRVTAYRVGEETPIQVSKSVHAYAERFRHEIPSNITVAIWNDDSEILRSRMDLLISNASMGFILVAIVLGLLMEVRIAAWVAWGIPTSFLGAFALMPVLGISINMVTLFALLVTLGLVVDDAIVVGENIYTKIQAGIPRTRAAIEGAREMAMPVSFSILTTVAAFAPLFFVPGVTGKIFRLIPAVVITVLVISWMESFFVFPAHLAHGEPKKKGIFNQWADRIREVVSAWLDRVTRHGYRPLAERLLRHRGIVIATATALLILTMATVISGLVPFSFFPQLEGDVVTASARLPIGASIEQTKKVQKQLEASGMAAIEAHGGKAIFRGMFTSLGEGMGGGGRSNPAQADLGSHLVTIQMELTPSDVRTVTASEIRATWAAKMPAVAGVETLVFRHTTGPSAGKAVDIQLSHWDTTVLAHAADDISASLRSIRGLTNVENTYTAGKNQLDFHITEQARTLGLSAADIARQIRTAFFGAEATRQQRGRNELKVMVRLPAAQRASEYHLESLYIRTPAGSYVPLPQVAEFERGHAPTHIQREDGKRIVNVSAELAAGVESPRAALEAITRDIVPVVEKRYAGLNIGLVGQQREQAETFSNLGKNFILALFAIFALLAIPFRSYVQPLIVMTAIPFGFVGAIGGHLLLGYGMSIMSVFGIIALSGVVVNDSLVLVDAINIMRKEGLSLWDAVLSAGVRRMRPILLTSLTTFFGLAPMILEKSVQARFLIPMAISLGFGVMFSTLVVLFLVPCLYVMTEDVRSMWQARFQPHKAATQTHQHTSHTATLGSALLMLAMCSVLSACGHDESLADVNPHNNPPFVHILDTTTVTFAQSVVQFSPGPDAGFGQAGMPSIVLGPPHGRGTYAGSLDVVSLGRGGSIILGFGNNTITDGPGADFTVFENAFIQDVTGVHTAALGSNARDTTAEQVHSDPTDANHTDTRWFDFGSVAVSNDMQTWTPFPCNPIAMDDRPYAQIVTDAVAPSHPWHGCAGWHAVQDNGTGGDPFDLSDIGITEARYVRITDLKGLGAAPSAGFDLDAIGVMHWNAL